jgi:hypothetical protein
MKAQNKIVEMSKNDENKTIRIIADEMLNH